MNDSFNCLVQRRIYSMFALLIVMWLLDWVINGMTCTLIATQLAVIARLHTYTFNTTSGPRVHEQHTFLFIWKTTTFFLSPFSSTGQPNTIKQRNHSFKNRSFWGEKKRNFSPRTRDHLRLFNPLLRLFNPLLRLRLTLCRRHPHAWPLHNVLLPTAGT